LAGILALAGAATATFAAWPLPVGPSPGHSGLSAASWLLACPAASTGHHSTRTALRRHTGDNGEQAVGFQRGSARLMVTLVIAVVAGAAGGDGAAGKAT
jgi:hypothetical protein